MAAPSNFMDVYRRHVRPACAVIKELWPVYEVCAAFSPAVTNRTEYIRHEAKQLGRRSFAEPRLVDASLEDLVRAADRDVGQPGPRKWSSQDAPLVLEPPHETLTCPCCDRGSVKLECVKIIEVFTSRGPVRGFKCEARCDCGYVAKPSSAYYPAKNGERAKELVLEKHTDTPFWVVEDTAFEKDFLDAHLVDTFNTHVTFDAKVRSYNHLHKHALQLVSNRKLNKQIFQHAFMMYKLFGYLRKLPGVKPDEFDIYPMRNATHTDCRDALDARMLTHLPALIAAFTEKWAKHDAKTCGAPDGGCKAACVADGGFKWRRATCVCRDGSYLECPVLGHISLGCNKWPVPGSRVCAEHQYMELDVDMMAKPCATAPTDDPHKEDEEEEDGPGDEDQEDPEWTPDGAAAAAPAASAAAPAGETRSGEAAVVPPPAPVTANQPPSDLTADDLAYKGRLFLEEGIVYRIKHVKWEHLDYVGTKESGWQKIVTYFDASLMGEGALYPTEESLPSSSTDAIYNWQSLEEVRNEEGLELVDESALSQEKTKERSARTKRLLERLKRKAEKKARSTDRPEEEEAGGWETDDAPKERADHPRPERKKKSAIASKGIFATKITASASCVETRATKYLAEVVAGRETIEHWFAEADLPDKLVQNFKKMQREHANKRNANGSDACGRGARLVYTKDTEDAEEGKEVDRQTCASNLKEYQRDETRHTTAGILVFAWSCGYIYHISELIGSESISQV